jgi:hypothetical protein
MAFDAITPTRFGASELAISPALTTIRTTPTHARDILKGVDIANNGISTAAVSVYLVPSGDVAGADNLLVPAVQIPVNTIFQWTGTQVTDAGATIRANSSIAGVTLTASGGESI